MRSTITISLPGEQVKELKNKAKKRGFPSFSEYVRFLGSLDEDLISTKNLLAMATRAERYYKKGKLQKAGSLAKYL